MQDLKGIDIQPGFHMVSDVFQDGFRDFPPGLSVQRDKHCPAERFLDEAVHNRHQIACKRGYVFRRRPEAEGGSQLKQKPDMEIAEIRLHGIEEQNAFTAPGIQSRLFRPFLQDTVKDLAHEHCNGILEHTVPYAGKRIYHDRPACREQVRPAVFRNPAFENIHRQQHRSKGIFPDTSDKEAFPSEIPAEGMYNDRIVPRLCMMKDDKLRYCGHVLSAVQECRHCP